MKQEKLLVEKYESCLKGKQETVDDHSNQNNKKSYKDMASALCGGSATNVTTLQEDNQGNIQYGEKLNTIFRCSDNFHTLHNQAKSLFSISEIGHKLYKYRNEKANMWHTISMYDDSIDVCVKQADILIRIDKKLTHYTERLENIDEEKNETLKEKKIARYLDKVKALGDELKNMKGRDNELEAHIESLKTKASILEQKIGEAQEVKNGILLN